MNLPNKLTTLRMILVPVMVVLFYIGAVSPLCYILATATFIVAAFTDFLDGYIARKYNLVTDFGKFMDPLADKALVLVALILIVDKGIGSVADSYALLAYVAPVSLIVMLIRELVVAETVKDLLPLESKGIYLTTYCSNNEVALVMRTAENTDPYLVNDVVLKISERFGRNIYSFSNEELETTAYKLLDMRGKKVSTVESVTGGLIASKLVSVPGMSKYFNEGLVTYSVNSKVFRLNVSPDLIEEKGVVSKDVAIAMCEGLLENPLNEIAIATTGNAGPSAEPGDEEVGVCYIAIGVKGDVKAFRHKFVGDRNYVREATAKQSLFYLVNLLKYNEI